MREVRESPENGVATLIDLASYAPDLGSPMMFVASPILDEGQLSGILAFKISTEPIDAIMTSEGNWVEEGFGGTGEVYLTGEDGRMRSVARPFVENPSAFLIDLEAAETATETERTAMAGVGTTAIFLRASEASELTAAAESEDLTRDATDYLLRPVLAAVERLDLGEFTWYAVSQVETDEVAGPISDFRQALLIAVAIFVIGITFGTVSWARGVFRPVRSISERLRLAQSDEPIPEPEGMENAPTDFTDLSDNIDEMLEALRIRQADLEKASQDRIDTVRSLLPASIAERVQSGDRDVIDHIPQASIVVVVTEGLGELVRTQDIARTQEMLESLIAEIDGAAAHHGLERVKLVGDAYYAGCGLNQPFLDHVPRSVSFALDARDIVEEFNSRLDTPLLAGVGIHTGPVTVGLTGSQKLVYDLWGETVRIAHFLARKAQPREILVTNDVRRLLPPDIAVAEQQVPGEGENIFQVLGIQVVRGVGDE
jgi:class 3 adenylate cyclase